MSLKGLLKHTIMSKIFSQIFLLAFMSVSLSAVAESKVYIGLCDGEVASISNIGVNSAGTNIEAASILPAEMLKDFEDLKALGVNVGLTSRLNIAEIKVWVRETLDGPDLFEASLTKSEGIKTGWNNVMGEATPLPQGKDLYVGYTLIVSGASYPVSVVGEARAGTSWVNTDGEWRDLSDNGCGVLSVELIATASNLIPFDLVLKQASMPEGVKIGSSVPLELKIYNAGAEPVSGYQIECETDGYEPVVYDINRVVKPNEYADVVLDFVSPVQQKTGEVRMSVRISGINDGEDANMANNETQIVYSVNRFDFVKRVLIEEFSTERCTYCPRVAATLHDILAEPEFDGKAVAAVHHAGFGVDWLTISASNSYLWFYNGGTGNTFAPAFMYDRFAFDNETPVSNGTDVYGSIKEKVAERLRKTPMTALEASAEFNPSTSQLTVKVEGERLRDYDGDRITIFVVENNIEAKSQAGVSGDFVHQHVLREVNEIWGDEINWDSENSFVYETALYINPSWNTENIEVYAFTSKYNSTNYKDCTIDNVVTAAVNWNEAGLKDVEADDIFATPEYYTITGIKVKNPSNGIYIVKRGNHLTKEYIR